ncbi:MAG: tetratricopeptide repeat protein [Gaiella sp.]
MARFEKPSKSGTPGDAGLKRPRPVAPKRAPKSYEDTLFLSRIRRRAKVLIVLLGVFFSLGFVLFGVGAGGIGVGDVFRGGGSDGVQSVEDARTRTEERPRDPEAWRTLVTALQNEQDNEGAVEAQRKVVELLPKDDNALRELAGLQLALVSDRRQDVQRAQVDSLLSAPGQTFQGFLVNGSPVIEDPVVTAVTDASATEQSQAAVLVQNALNDAVTTYQQLAKLVPEDAPAQLELAQTAEQAQNTRVALGAYQRFLELAPDDPSASLVRQQVKALREAGVTPIAG